MPSRTTRIDAGLPVDEFQNYPLQHIRKLFIRFLQGLYWYRPVGNYHWEPDIENSEIYISDEFPVHDSVVGARPCLVLSRSPVQLSSVGLDDMSGYSFATGQKTKTVVIPGNMSINCCARVAQEAENLGFFTAEHLWLMRDILQKAGFMHVGQNISVGPPSGAGAIIANDSGDEWYAVSVIVPFKFHRTSSITPLGQAIVKGVSVFIQSTTGTSYPGIESTLEDGVLVTGPNLNRDALASPGVEVEPK